MALFPLTNFRKGKKGRRPPGDKVGATEPRFLSSFPATRGQDKFFVGTPHTVASRRLSLFKNKGDMVQKAPGGKPPGA